MDINLGLRGLHSLEQFIKMAAGAETERTVMNALKFKYDHSRKVAQQFIKTGLQDTMFTWQEAPEGAPELQKGPQKITVFQH